MKRALIAGLIAVVVASAVYSADAPTCYTVATTAFDGAKFKARYKLARTDFTYINGQVCLRADLTLPDNPPIFDAPEPLVAARNAVRNNIDKDKVLRAILLIVLDEFNAHANKLNAILTAVDDATSLADLKTRVAAIPDYPQRTQAQLINAIKAQIDSGAAD